MENFKKGFISMEVFLLVAGVVILITIVIIVFFPNKDKDSLDAAKQIATSIASQIRNISLDGGGIVAPLDNSTGGGPICTNCSSNEKWPSLAKTGYVYNVITDSNIFHGDYSFSLVKQDEYSIAVSLSNGVISISINGLVLKEDTPSLSKTEEVCGFLIVGGYGVVLAKDGKCWLDRNLGAKNIAKSYNDSNAYGDLYQWGRGADGHQVRDSGTTTILSITDSPGNNNFIKNSVSDYSWRDPMNYNLWQGVNGINNPCPTGFRLPTISEWETLISTERIINSATAYNSTLKLVAGGYRGFDNANINLLNTYGFYWASSISTPYPFSINFGKSSIDFDNKYPYANGESVRCVKN